MDNQEGSQAQPHDRLDAVERPIDGPVPVGWREGTLTRAKELESLAAWDLERHRPEHAKALERAIGQHLEAARQAAQPNWRYRLRGLFRNGALIERAMSNLDAAEAHLLNVASADYVLGQMACLLNHVQCHLIPADPRRRELERIAGRLGLSNPGPGHLPRPNAEANHDHLDKRRAIVDEERGRIVTAMRAASSAALREQVRLRSFRNALIIAILLMTVLVVSVAVMGWFRPTMIPLCFAPEESGQAKVVCPIRQSGSFSTTGQVGSNLQPSSPTQDIDDFVQEAASRQDLLTVEFVGLAAAAVAAAAAIRGIHGSSERHSIPVLLAALKLPLGALTAFLGLLLMRGQFVPGLSALDSSAQILAWALVFGYAQQLFTRLVDRQGQTVLESVRGANRHEPDPTPP